jgi:hypothetical protein
MLKVFAPDSEVDVLNRFVGHRRKPEIGMRIMGIANPLCNPQ